MTETQLAGRLILFCENWDRVIPTIRPIMRAMGLYQDHEASINNAQRARGVANGTIDDIIVLAETEEIARDHTAGLI